uniref:Translocon-associated protein subunit beta n=1 Tax=Isotomurus palustris TaxID=36144 RepID=A0A481SWB7_9HEXA|nr:translocon-associated protein, beta subunit precursor [Isotomurus palustris]
MMKGLLLTSVALLASSLLQVSSDTPPSSSSLGSSDDPARLLVSKQLLNKYVVESMDVVIKYSVYNVGAVTATDVQLKDASFGPDFLVVGGQAEVNLGRLPPSANATHTLVVRPIKFGYYNFTAAQVTYKSGDESAEVLQGWSSEPGEGYIAPFREFDKRFSPHLLDWAAFAIMSVPPLVIPFMLWHSSKAKYEGVLLSKKSK